MLEPISAPAGQARLIRARRSTFSVLALRRALLNEVGLGHAALEVGNEPERARATHPAPGPGAQDAGHASSTARRSFASASGAGSQAVTSSPRARQRAAQPAPITPVPTIATLTRSLRRPSFARVSSGPSTRAPRSRTISQARSTSSPFEANTPRPR